MALDIKEGDYLVVGSREYPIRACQEWAWPSGRGGIRLLLRLTVSTKRQPALVDGKRGAPATLLTGVRCTPLDPIQVTPEIRERLDLRTPHEALETFVDGKDTYYRLVLEDLKK